MGAVITRSALPLSNAAQQLREVKGFWDYVITGGDDYELLFTAPAAARAAVEKLGATRIGEIVVGSGARVLDADGGNVTPQQQGWEY